jgi:hypothetical protein
MMEETIEFGQEVSTAELDEAVRELREAREAYDVIKAEATKAHFQVENAQKKITELLTKAGKSKYDAEGIGKVNIVERLSVSYPKDLEERKKFMQWIDGKLGEDGILTYLTVNIQTLNSLYKQEYDNEVLNGDPSTFTIPGLPEPTASLSVRFNRAK